jgi:hypothetical protein
MLVCCAGADGDNCELTVSIHDFIYKYNDDDDDACDDDASSGTHQRI